MRNTYGFSIAKMFARTRLNVALCVHYLSCSFSSTYWLGRSNH